MGTRGFLGFVIDGQEKIGYRHSDAYPEGQGLQVLHFLLDLAENDPTRDLKAEVRALRMVATGRDIPTAEEVERLAPWTNNHVSAPEDIWYRLLRHSMGDLHEILACGIMEDAADSPLDGASWGYLVDLDEETFDVYESTREPHLIGRYALRQSLIPGRYPPKLVATWRLTELPTEDEFLTALGRDNLDA